LKLDNKKNSLGDWLEYILFNCFFIIVKLTPLSVGVVVGKALGRLAFFVMRKRRKLTLNNIRHARDRGFFSADIDEYKLARKVWENIGTVGSEFLFYYTRPLERLRESFKVSGENNLRRVLDQQKGVILVTGHIGNWELIGIYLSMAGYKITPIVKTQSNALVDKIIQEHRRSIGMKVIPRRSYLRPILEAFRNNEIVPFLIDQSARNKGVKVDFFGAPAPFPRGAVEFALKTGVPVIFSYVIREKPGNYQLVFSEEIVMEKTNQDETDLVKNTETLIQRLQEVIMKHPEQWLWMHKMWRNQKL
jgi:KDO2-lipid IV(A) lauroyltransferase